jgi:hypothetical protein
MQSLGAVFFVFTLGLICAADLPAQQRITVSYPGIAGYNIPFWMALDGGEFKKAGLNVEAVLISGGTKSMQALLSGGLDFAHVSGGMSVQANLNGADHENQSRGNAAGHRKVYSRRLQGGGGEDLRIFRQEHLGHAAHRARRYNRFPRNSGSEQAGRFKAQYQRVHW